MISSRLMFCADGIAIDQRTNTVSAFSIVEEAHPEGFPAVLPRLHVVTWLEREDEDEPRVQLTLRVGLGDETLVDRPIDIDFQARLKTRSIVVLTGVTVPRLGILQISLWNGDQRVNTYEIFVTPPARPRVEEREG